jgi:bis(5'-nucleosyl)-tetraphosphatase (symmetrical)
VVPKQHDDAGFVMFAPGSWCSVSAAVVRRFAYCTSVALTSALHQPVSPQCDNDRPANLVRLLHSRQDSRHALLLIDANVAPNVLIIGDVHGCYDEMMQLYQSAGAPAIVILVGDLVNKGPHSAKVVRHVRTTPGWFAVRGNHDDGTLRAAMGDPADQRAAKSKKKYDWLFGKTEEDDTGSFGSSCVLSKDDLLWLHDLPYTIRIPATDPEESDILIVHAGLVPGIPLEDQSNATMMTLRTVVSVLVSEEDGQQQSSSYHYGASSGGSDGVPWASVWTGPDFVIFGHDARRGLQRERHALGLDTGACYGKQLTGIVLPSKTMYQVDSLRTYCSIGSED